MEHKKKNIKNDAIEQYGRRLTLEIVGVPFTVGEYTNKIAFEIAEVLNIELSENQIPTSHRLQSLKDDDNNAQQTSPIIIVRFLSRDVRNKIYAKRKLARSHVLCTIKHESVSCTKKTFHVH